MCTAKYLRYRPTPFHSVHCHFSCFFFQRKSINPILTFATHILHFTNSVQIQIEDIKFTLDQFGLVKPLSVSAQYWSRIRSGNRKIQKTLMWWIIRVHFLTSISSQSFFSFVSCSRFTRLQRMKDSRLFDNQPEDFLLLYSDSKPQLCDGLLKTCFYTDGRTVDCGRLDGTFTQAV